ncbi:MAG TPA: hypothetical protein VK600_00510 [Candidatus Saccharimonadales bacterium]|nr:hypothetical protein [Candidatus Saccharimonadales bacterium]
MSDVELRHECHRCHALADDTELIVVTDEHGTWFVHRRACS